MLKGQHTSALVRYRTRGVGLLLIFVVPFFVEMRPPSLCAAEPVSVDGAAMSKASPDRLTVAVLGFGNKTGDASMVYWRTVLENGVAAELKEIRSIRVLPSVERALEQSGTRGIQDGGPGDEVQAQRCGELLHAQRVIWGDYQREGEKFQTTAHVLNVPTRQLSKDVVINSTNCSDVGTGLIEQIIQTLGVRPTQPEHENMRQHWTSSPLALECYGKAVIAGGQSRAEAETWLRQAIEADPRFVDARIALSETLMHQSKTKEAEELARDAVLSQPQLAITHKEYGWLLWFEKKSDEAESELKAAAQFDPDDAETFRHLGNLYFERMQESQATDYYKKALALDPCASFAADVRSKLDYLHQRGITYYITNSPPKEYSGDSLMETLRNKLSPEELPLVVNPLASNTEMAQWARQLTSKATNDLQRARMLFDEIVRHARPGAPPLSREATAQEVFADWNTRKATVYCEQAAVLFIGLARTVGVKAYMVSVDETYDSLKTFHVCAACYCENKALLVDPAYFWFGARHKRFVILDDVQSIASYLCGLDGLKEKEIARKLAPELALVQDNLCHNLMYLNRWEEARELLPEIIRLDGDSAMAKSTQAAFALHDGNPGEAIDLLLKAIEIDPYDFIEYMELGNACRAQGRRDEAYQCYQSALQCLHTQKQADYINHIIKEMSAK